MSDARWLDVDDDIAEATRHFRNAVALFDVGQFADPGLAGYRDGMALMHALQAGHTSVENAFLRILSILGEEAPTGADWHAKLIQRVSRANGRLKARPAVTSPTTAADLDETRRFRNRAMRNYGGFDAAKAGPTLTAAQRLAETLAPEIVAFRAKVDPD